MVGGPGLRRGRGNPHRLSFGETVDFWRVTQYDRPRTLRLRAEMKLPGIAELLFEIEPDQPPGAPPLPRPIARSVSTQRLVRGSRIGTPCCRCITSSFH